MGSPFVYLGLSVGGNHKCDDFWNGVIEKVQARLSRWKGKCLSLAGRICLIKFVLSSIPLFFMSLFKLSSEVADKLVRIQKNFLWGWGSEGRKIVGLLGKRFVSLAKLGGLVLLI